MTHTHTHTHTHTESVIFKEVGSFGGDAQRDYRRDGDRRTVSNVKSPLPTVHGLYCFIDYIISSNLTWSTTRVQRIQH